MTCFTASTLRLAGVALAGLVLLDAPAVAQAPKIGEPAEANNMRLVGFNDLQARSAYQPTIHKQGDRYIAYIGHHGASYDAKPLNPLNRTQEFNGTSIVDVTDPGQPKYLAHIPGAEGGPESGGAQMTRVCDGRALPKGDANAVYLLRPFGRLAHEIWNVADPANPKLVTRIGGNYKDTHKSWWECDTGIAFLVSGVPGWRAQRMLEVYDLGDPSKPAKIRDFGLPGHEPGATGAVPSDLHGPISTGPQGNRLYLAYGPLNGGIFQIIDREKLLQGPKEATPANLRYPEVGRLDMSPLHGAHTSFPLLQMPLAEFAKSRVGAVRDFVMIVSEATGRANGCQETHQMVWFADISVEAKPMMVSNFSVPESQRQLLRPRCALRRPFLQREYGAGVSQEARLHHLFRRRGAGARRAQSLSSQGGRPFHPGDDGSNREALLQDRRPGALHHVDPEQQRRNRRPRLHLCRRPGQYRHAYFGVDW